MLPQIIIVICYVWTFSVGTSNILLFKHSVYMHIYLYTLFLVYIYIRGGTRVFAGGGGGGAKRLATAAASLSWASADKADERGMGGSDTLFSPTSKRFPQIIIMG